MADFLKMFQQVQQMQGRLQEMQDELQKVTVSGAAGGGMVKVDADGKGRVRRIVIDPSVVNAADVEMLQELIVGAVNDAHAKAAQAAQAEMAKVTGGLNLPFPLPLP